MKVLSIGSDAKTIKGEKRGYLTGISYQAPSTMAGMRTTCPFATKECSDLCLGKTSGRMPMPNVRNAMIERTKLWLNEPTVFLSLVSDEIEGLKRKAKRENKVPCVRLNGTSDIQWEKTGIMEKFPEVQFYDYTKFPPNQRTKLPSNYHLTYSYTGRPESKFFAEGWNKRGVNTAVVFRGGLPSEFMGKKVVDGDLSDLRFLDEKNVIVGLKAKGAARKGESSFVVEVNK